jgi:thiamine biosynthesis lipoprotein
MKRVLVPRHIAPPDPAGAAGAANVVSLGGATMGTGWSVRFVPPARVVVADVGDAIAAELDLVIRQMSTWIDGSDTSRFNRAAADCSQTLPAEFAAVLRCALDVAGITGGAYDPTVGALVDLWGFGPRGGRDSVPTEDEIADAAARCGWRRLAFDPALRRVRQPGGLQIDLSSIAKGYAVDRVAERLSALGIAHHLVEIGGELRGQGMKPGGSPWWVALEQPQAEPQAERAESSDHAAGLLPETIVALHGLSVATSGDSQRRFTVGGQVLSHTIDPRNGRPVSGPLASVTVLHPCCMLADVWATALTVLGPDEGFKMACTQRLAARFVLRGAAALEERMTPAFAAMLD